MNVKDRVLEQIAQCTDEDLLDLVFQILLKASDRLSGQKSI